MEAKGEFLDYIINKTDSNKFYFTSSVVSVLSLVSGIDPELIKKTRIHTRSFSRYIPMYNSRKGGGAITLGNAFWHSITYTENFFSNDKAHFGNAAFGDRLMTWLRLSAHEVGHIAHAKRYKSLLWYLIVFLYQYIRYGHDKAPLEIEAESGRQKLMQFNRFIKKVYQNDLEKILRAESSEVDKIEVIQNYWNQFIKEEEKY